mgnify:CR=1 FL=1
MNLDMNLVIIVVGIFGLIIGFIIGIFMLEVRIFLIIVRLKDKIKEKLFILETQKSEALGNRNLENAMKEIESNIFSSYDKIMNYIANFLIFCIFILFVFFLIFLFCFK